MEIHNPVISGSLVVSGSINIEGQPAGTVISASYATTASYALNGGGGGGGGGDTFPYTGSAIISGSLVITGSLLNSFNQQVGNYSTWCQISSLSFGRSFGGQFGETNATVVTNGYNAPVAVTCTEEYDGSSWATGGATPSGHLETAGFGTLNAGVLTGGRNPDSDRTLHYNGTSWTTATNVPTYRDGHAAAGTQNAGMIWGGGLCSPPSLNVNDSNCTSEYNGSTWSAGGTFIIPIVRHTGGGTQNSALSISGYSYTCTTPSVYKNCVRSYNGVNWSTESNYPLCLYYAASVVDDSDNAVVTTGFSASPTACAYTCTYCWNGISWTAGDNYSGPATYGVCGSGATGQAIFAGGYCGTPTDVYQLGDPGGYTPANAVQFNGTDGSIVLSQVSNCYNYADDTAAASGGIPLGGLYHSSGSVKIRIS